VLDDPSRPGDREEVTRLLMCSGKVFYELAGHELRPQQRHVAIGRVELLYPFAKQEVTELIQGYPNLREVMWVQEEPRNMGARSFMKPRILEIVPEGVSYGYVGRDMRASASEGYTVAHRAEQQRIVSEALELGR
jgi:2-oxoglutarate dehydrogenase E1 component